MGSIHHKSLLNLTYLALDRSTPGTNCSSTYSLFGSFWFTTLFAVFVKRLQKCLVRIEVFDIVGVTQSMDSKSTLFLSRLSLMNPTLTDSKRGSSRIL